MRRERERERNLMLVSRYEIHHPVVDAPEKQIWKYIGLSGERAGL